MKLIAKHKSVLETMNCLKCNAKSKGIYQNVVSKLMQLADTGHVYGFSRKLSDKLYELKVSKIRMLYTMQGNNIMLVYAYVKSTPKLPCNILRCAEQIINNKNFYTDLALNC